MKDISMEELSGQYYDVLKRTWKYWSGKCNHRTCPDAWKQGGYVGSPGAASGF